MYPYAFIYPAKPRFPYPRMENITKAAVSQTVIRKKKRTTQESPTEISVMRGWLNIISVNNVTGNRS